MPLLYAHITVILHVEAQRQGEMMRGLRK